MKNERVLESYIIFLLLVIIFGRTSSCMKGVLNFVVTDAIDSQFC